MDSPISLGDIVKSRMGRDKGILFVVLKIEGDYIYMANGTTRKMDHLKKKKVKHLAKIANDNGYITKKLSANEKITNAELRREISENTIE